MPSFSRIQQHQISGSLSGVVSDSYDASSDLTIAANRSLVQDLNDLRRQVNRVIGKGSWSSKLDGDQDLAAYYAAIHLAGANVDLQGTLDVTGAAVLDSSLDVAGHSTLDSAEVTNLLEGHGGLHITTGTATFDGLVDANFGVEASSVKIDGDVAQRLYFVGADGSISDNAALNWDIAASRLDVTGSVDISSQLAANAIKIDGDVAQRLYFVGADGSISDNAALNWDIAASRLDITGSLDVSNDLRIRDDLQVDDDVSILGDAGVGGAFQVTGASTLAGGVGVMNGATISGGATVSGNSTFSNDLGVSGAATLGSLAVTGNALFNGNATIQGNLEVKGLMTYVETDNLKIKDAFIHLATGSNGTQSSGIVLHGGAGASGDLMIAQDSGAGEFVFALVPGGDHSDVDGDNSVTVNNSALAKAWMSGSLYGSSEGSQLGFVGMDVLDFVVKGTNILMLGAGADEVSFIGGGEQTTFDGNFPASTLVGAVNSLKSALDALQGGGSSAKGTKSGADVSMGALDFSSIGTLADDDHKLIDVFLNGVLMAPTLDLTALTTTSVTFAGSIASSLSAEDVITVVLRSTV